MIRICIHGITDKAQQKVRRIDCHGSNLYIRLCTHTSTPAMGHRQDRSLVGLGGRRHCSGPWERCVRFPRVAAWAFVGIMLVPTSGQSSVDQRKGWWVKTANEGDGFRMAWKRSCKNSPRGLQAYAGFMQAYQHLLLQPSVAYLPFIRPSLSLLSFDLYRLTCLTHSLTATPPL